MKIYCECHLGTQGIKCRYCKVKDLKDWKVCVQNVSTKTREELINIISRLMEERK